MKLTIVELSDVVCVSRPAIRSDKDGHWRRKRRRQPDRPPRRKRLADQLGMPPAGLIFGDIGDVDGQGLDIDAAGAVLRNLDLDGVRRLLSAALPGASKSGAVTKLSAPLTGLIVNLAASGLRSARLNRSGSGCRRRSPGPWSPRWCFPRPTRRRSRRRLRRDYRRIVGAGDRCKPMVTV